MTDVEFHEALSIAVKALARHEKFTAEIRGLLEKKGFERGTIERTVEHLTAKGILNDRRCAELAIARLNAKANLGRGRLSAAMEARGAPADLVHALMPPEPTRDHLLAILAKRFPQGAEAPRAARYLCSRGFQEDEAISASEAYAEGALGS